MFYFSIHILLFKSIACKKSSFKTHIDVSLSADVCSSKSTDDLLQSNGFHKL